MNKYIAKAFILMFASISLFTSCIKDEAPNAEADIISVKVDGITLLRQPEVSNNEIKMYNGWDDVTKLAPTFTITDGATIEPASGTVRDFTTPQTYTVTSQDGQWKKVYTVSFISNDIVTHYSFDAIKPTTAELPYHVFIDKGVDGGELEWGSGNKGFNIVARGKPATDYPTSQAVEGLKGACAKLTTVSTGKNPSSFFGIYIPGIAAGNLFIGEFKPKVGGKTSYLKATSFGIPFRKKPEILVGYYKYKAGDKLVDSDGKEIMGKKDDFAIYAVLFENTVDNKGYLDGGNSLSSKDIVLKAELTDRKETGEWTKFTLPFEVMNGKTIEPKKLAEGGYSFAIIMSSSKDGAKFEGAIGSTLYVDELQLFCE